MKDLYRKVFILIFSSVIATSFYSCSGTQKTAAPKTQKKEITEATSVYPEWYQPKTDYASDSLSFYGYGIAVSRDSLQSVQKATQQAKVNLDNGVARALEDIRRDLAQDLNKQKKFANPQFLVNLANSHDISEKLASVGNIKSAKKHNVYRSFVKVKLDKKEFAQKLQGDFQASPAFVKRISQL